MNWKKERDRLLSLLIIYNAEILGDEHKVEMKAFFNLFPRELDMVPLEKKLQGITQFESCLF
jgi:hypothetical protein